MSEPTPAEATPNTPPPAAPPPSEAPEGVKPVEVQNGQAGIFSEDKPADPAPAPAAAPEAAPAPNGQTPAPAALPDGWREEMGKGLEGDDLEAWRNQASRFSSQQDVAKTLVEQRRMISNSIVIPAEDDAEGRGEVYDKLGRPKTPDEYQLPWNPDTEGPLDDADKAAFDEFKPIAHRHGMRQAGVDEIVQLQKSKNKAAAEAFRVKAEDIARDRSLQLKTSWGDDHDENVKVYRGTARHYMGERGVEEFSQIRLEDGTFAADHPIIAEAFTRVGRERANDDFDYTPMNASRKQDAQSQLKDKQAELVKQGLRPGMPGYPTEEMEQLYKAAASTRKRRGDRNDQYRTRR